MHFKIVITYTSMFHEYEYRNDRRLWILTEVIFTSWDFVLIDNYFDRCWDIYDEADWWIHSVEAILPSFIGDFEIWNSELVYSSVHLGG